ncbi:MAG: hypothetical protein ABIH65_03690 [Nanoarchaeota archaeon]
MSQIEEDKRSTEIKEEVDYLGGIFNLSQFWLLSYPEKPSENDFLDETRKETENKTYQNIVSGLESDLKNLGMDITYASKIIIREIAMNLLFLQRVKASLICKDLLVEKMLLKPSYSSSKKENDYSHYKSSSRSISYDYLPSNNNSVHPLFEKLVPQLQKQINDGLKALALLPCQQIERQKLTIIKKLRQRCESLDKEYTIKAESQKSLLNQGKPQVQEIKTA